MWYVYVIKSRKDGYLYKGMSQKPTKRLRVHNAGKVRSTKSHASFDLVYIEEVGTRLEARAREKYLKSAASRHFFRMEIGI